MGGFYSKRYFYKGGIGMTQSLKRFASAVLALVMAMTCLVFSNVASVSAADDASDCVAMGSYEWNSTALGGTAKTGTYNNMTYSLRKVDSSYVQLRSENTIKFKVAQDCTLTATFSNNGLFINGTALTSDKAYSLKADTEYTLTGDSGNTNLTKLVFATNSTETTTKATTTTETTTTTTTEATTEATTVSSDYVAMGSYEWNSTALGGTETTTKATTTTETTTETTTVSVQVWTPDNKTNILGSAVSGLSTSKASGRTSAFVDSIFGDGETATGAINGQNYVLLNDENIIPTATGKLKLYVIANSNGAVTNGTITTGDTAVYSGAFAARNGDTAVKAITINVEAGKTYKVSSQVMLFRAELTPTGSTETSTETTTTTTTETSTETTTMGVLKVMVNNPASSKISTVEVTVKRNGKAVSGVTALNIGSATEIAGVNEDDVITFTFAKEQAKQITNWDSNLKSVFRDKTYTLTYTVGKTVATPTMDYYDSMPAAVSLGQSTTTAAGYGTYGFGQYKVQTNGNDLAKYAIIRGHQYSLLDVGSGDYDKDGTEFGIPDERVLLLGGTDDEIELTNSIDSSEKVLVLLDCSGDNAIVTATGGNLYSSYDGSTGTTAAQITGISKNGVKVQFYVDGGTTITVKGTGTSANAYTVVKSIRLFNLNNIVDGDKAVNNGVVSTMTEDSPFYDVVTTNGLANDDMLFTLIGTVTGNHKDKDFLNQVDKVGFVILNADTVDANDPNGQYTPMQLKYNNPDVNFGGIYVETTDIYKNVYDATNYDSSLDSSEGYTGDTDSSLTTSDKVAYFAELVSVSAGHRYYAYPYTLYAGATQRAYDTNPKGTRIEISNKQ